MRAVSSRGVLEVYAYARRNAVTDVQNRYYLPVERGWQAGELLPKSGPEKHASTEPEKPPAPSAHPCPLQTRTAAPHDRL